MRPPFPETLATDAWRLLRFVNGLCVHRSATKKFFKMALAKDGSARNFPIAEPLVSAFARRQSAEGF
jgi:hypothetical protein